jgi:hypothetical protein
VSKKILITITDEMSEATAPLMQATGDKSLSEMVRRLLGEEAARVGAEWPDNMPSPETNIQKANQARSEMNTTETTPNIYYATNAKTGETEYFVGTYRDGRYTRSLSERERRATGASAEQGDLSYVGCQYTSKSSAQAAARRQFGYSKIESAVFNLGKRYQLG